MELKLNLQIENLYGGDGNLRFIEEKSTKLIRTKSKKTTKSSTGVSSENAVGEEQSELVKKEIQTFKMYDGKPTYKFGGIHGKMWGHFRASGKMLAELGAEGFDSKAFVDRMMMSVIIMPMGKSINPIEAVIEEYEPMQVGEIPQITQGISKALIIQKFDYLPKCKIQMKLVFPDMYKDKILAILKQSEDMAGMNKRRATMKILNREIFK